MGCVWSKRRGTILRSSKIRPRLQSAHSACGFTRPSRTPVRLHAPKCDAHPGGSSRQDQLSAPLHLGPGSRAQGRAGAGRRCAQSAVRLRPASSPAMRRTTETTRGMTMRVVTTEGGRSRRRRRSVQWRKSHRRSLGYPPGAQLSCLNEGAGHAELSRRGTIMSEALRLL